MVKYKEANTKKIEEVRKRKEKKEIEECRTSRSLSAKPRKSVERPSCNESKKALGSELTNEPVIYDRLYKMCIGN